MAMAYHRTVTVATDVRVYFSDPQSPWKRGTNETTNSLLREYAESLITWTPSSSRQPSMKS